MFWEVKSVLKWEGGQLNGRYCWSCPDLLEQGSEPYKFRSVLTYLVDTFAAEFSSRLQRNCSDSGTRLVRTLSIDYVDGGSFAEAFEEVDSKERWGIFQRCFELVFVEDSISLSKSARVCDERKQKVHYGMPSIGMPSIWIFLELAVRRVLKKSSDLSCKLFPVLVLLCVSYLRGNTCLMCERGLWLVDYVPRAWWAVKSLGVEGTATSDLKGMPRARETHNYYS